MARDDLVEFTWTLSNGTATFSYPRTILDMDRDSLAEWIDFVHRVFKKRLEQPSPPASPPRRPARDP